MLLEPFASPTERRLEAMKKLTEADVTPDEVIRKQIIDESQIPWSLKILEVKIEKPASLKKWWKRGDIIEEEEMLQYCRDMLKYYIMLEKI